MVATVNPTALAGWVTTPEASSEATSAAIKARE
jgi:hypothetical protein